jgi:RNA polymerase sigma-70 factor, ECF subfamily
LREPEPETIRRARAGDLAAFESLVREYQADVWRFAYHLTRNRASADDVTQEGFLRAFRAMRSFRGQSKFTSWLLRIVRNCAIDAYRKTRREIADPMDRTGADDVAARPSDATGAPSEERVRILDAVRRLPMDLREPFVVIEMLGFTYQEASTILGVRLGTVKSRMHRARAALMRELADEEATGAV